MPECDFRVIDGDDVVWKDRRFRLAGYDAPEVSNFRSKFDRGLERRRGYQAMLRLKVLIDSARAVYIIPWGTIVFPDRPLATLLINGWDVARIATHEGWGVEFKQRKKIDWVIRACRFQTCRSRQQSRRSNILAAARPQSIGSTAPHDFERPALHALRGAERMLPARAAQYVGRT